MIKFLSTMLVACHLASFLSYSQTPLSPAAGDGTETDPYQITSLENLRWIAESPAKWGAHFIQLTDIDASETRDWNDGAGWTPIGNNTTKFTGRYHGNGNVIDSLYINRPQADYQGLFGSAFIAEINDLHLTNVTITGGRFAGVLSGFIERTSINNCSSSGSISGTSRIGGLIGYAIKSSINNCDAKCEINAQNYGGGLIGHSSSTINHSYFSGNVVCHDYFGGLTGYNTGRYFNSYYNYDEVKINGENMITAGALYSNEFSDWVTNNKMLDVSNYLNFNGESFLIETVQDLKQLLAFGQDSTLSFILTNDLDLQDEMNFYVPYLSGSFNGDCHSIFNLKINLEKANNLGMFGELNNGKVEKLNLINIDIKGLNIVGGIAGSARNSSIISQCSSTGTIEASRYVGGLAGYLVNSGIINSFSGTSLSGYRGIGGIAGYTIESAIENTYTNSELTGNEEMGGLVGNNISTWINFSYSSGKVNPVSWLDDSGNNIIPVNFGGMIGKNTTSTILNSFWNIDLSGEASSNGGTGKSSGQMQNVATYTDVSTHGLSTAWDFKGNPNDDNEDQDYWELDDRKNASMPFLSWQVFPATLEVITYSISNISSNLARVIGLVNNLGEIDTVHHGFCWNTLGEPSVDDSSFEFGPVVKAGTFAYWMSGLEPNTEYHVRAYIKSNEEIFYGEVIRFTTQIIDPQVPPGTGTQVNPYRIENLNHLYWMTLNPVHWNKHYVQTTDIDASNSQFMENGKGWPRIGYPGNTFRGSYNGRGHYIDNLYINRPDENYQGLFGYIQNAKMDSLNLTNTNITGANFTGALAGIITGSSSVSYINVSGTIKGAGNTGGLAGRNASGHHITKCSSGVHVTGEGNTGGLIGWNGGILSLSFSSGTVIGQFNTGGLTGRNSWRIENCYSTSETQGDSVIGGLVGLNENWITNSYSRGTVNGVTSIGGLAGSGSGQYINSFWDTDLSGLEWSAGGTGLTSAEMKNKQTYTEAGWDFLGEIENGTENYWGIYHPVNEGYPFLVWQGYASLPTVETGAISDLTYSDATGAGTIMELGNPAPISQHGICWSTGVNPTIKDHKTEEGPLTEPADFSSVLSDLKPGTKYYARAYATSELGTSYGDVVSFTTEKRAIIIGGSFTAPDMEYTGRNIYLDVPLDSFFLIGVAEGHDVYIREVLIRFDDFKVGEGIPVIMEFVNLLGADIGRYIYPPWGLTYAYANIYPRTTKIGGSFTVHDKFYDKRRSATINTNNLTLLSKVEHDDLTLSDILLEFTDTIIGSNIEVKIVSASLSGEDGPNYILSLEDAPVSYASILPTPDYDLSVNIQGSGSVLMNDTLNISEYSIFTFKGLSEITLEAIPVEGSEFLGWSGDLTSGNPLETIIMDGNRSVTAIFRDAYLTLELDGSGAVLVNDSIMINHSQTLALYPGSEVSLKAVHFENCSFLEWTGDLASENNTETILMDRDKTIIAVFRKPILNLDIQGPGSILLNHAESISQSKSFCFEDNTIVFLEAISGENALFTHWTGNLISENASEQVTLDQYVSITANFRWRDWFILEIAISEGGSVVLNDSVQISGIYNISFPAREHTTVNLQAIPHQNYIFVGWTGETSSLNAVESIFMDKHKSISAVFELSSNYRQGNFQDIVFYPNPFTDYLNLSYDGEISRITLVNLLGETLWDILPEGNGFEQFQTANLEKGVYFITLYGRDGEKTTRKLIRR